MELTSKKYYETYNGAKHIIRTTDKITKQSFNLSLNGYLTLELKELYDNRKYAMFYTVNDKASFLLTLICNFIQNEKKSRGLKNIEKLTQKEFNENEDVKLLFSVLEKELSKIRSKGVRMRKNSFKDGYCNYICDNSHSTTVCNLARYLNQRNLELEDFLFNPAYIVEINDDYCRF